MPIDRVNLNVTSRQSHRSESETPLQFVLEAANVGTWEWTIDTNEVHWSENLEAIHGLAPGTFDGTFESFFRDVHPQDRQRVHDQIELALKTGRDYHVEYRQNGNGSDERWIEGRGRVIHDDSGRPARLVGICMNITDRKRAERNTAHLAAIVTHSDDAIISKTLDGIITSFNPAAEHMYGYRAEELIGKPVSILMPHDHADEFSSIMERIRHGERIEHFETIRRRKDGSLFNVSVAISPARDAEGNLIGVSAIARDITDRKRFEEQLRRSEERWRGLVSALPVGVYTVDSHGIIREYNDEAVRLWGRRPEPGETICGSWRIFLDGELFPLEECPMGIALRTGESQQNREITIQRPDGSYATALVNIAVFKDDDGNLLGAVNTLLDITDRKRYEEQLERSDSHWRNLVSAIPAGVYVCDADGRITEYNSHAAELWGRKPEPDDRICGSLRMWTPDGRPLPHEECPMATALRTGEAMQNAEVVVERPDGSHATVLVNISPLRNADGTVIGAVNCFQDITRRKRTDAVLRHLAEYTNLTGPDFYRSMLEHLIKALGTRWGLVGELKSDQLDRLCAVASIADGALQDHVEYDLAGTPCDIVCREGPQYFSGDLKAQFPDDHYLHEIGAACYLGVPLRRMDGSTLGVLSVLHDEPLENPKQAAALLEVVAGRAAASLELEHNIQAVRRSERNLADFFDNATLGLHWVNADGVIIRANRAELEMLGYEEHEYVGRHIAEFHVDQPVIKAILQRLQRGETLRDCPARLRHKDGSIRHVTINSSALFENGRFIHTRCFTRDVTEQRQAEDELAQHFAQLDTIYAGAPVGLAFTDTELRFVRVNEAMAKINGVPVEEHIGRTGLEIIGEQAAPIEEKLRQVIATGKPITNVEMRLALPSQPEEERDWLCSFHPVHDSSGKCIGVNAIVQDITARKRSEQALAESEVRARVRADELEALMESNPAAVFHAHDCECRLITGNQAAYDMLRRPRGVNLSKTAPDDERPTNFEIFHDGTPCQESELPVQRAARGEVISGDELELRFDDGSVIQIVCNAVPCFDDQGNPRGAVATFIDITEQKEAERQVRLMNATLEERVRERTTQLRMLARRLTQAEQQERRRLARILHDDLQQLLVASAMRAEQLAQRHNGQEVSTVAWQVHDLIQQSIQSARSLTSEICPPVLYDGGLAATLPWLVRRMEQRHGLNIHLEIDESAEPADEETRIALYLTARELLFNIAKYAGTSEAFVSLSHRNRESIHLVVEDRGVGFDTSHIEQSDESGGFGLFSLRERAELFGGRMTIHSEHGKGTRIEFELPLRPADGPHRDNLPTLTAAIGKPPFVDSTRQYADNRHRATGSHQDHRTRVLLVDDHQIVREGIAGILAEHSDIEVIAEAVDGRQAVELAREYRPDVVIMDITMPEMNGIEATRRIMRRPDGVVVIGLSMHDSPDMARAMKDAGAARVLVKDGPAEALIEAIRETSARATIKGN